MPQHDDDIIPHQDETEQVIDERVNQRRKLFSFADIFTPAAGIDYSYGECYINGAELVCRSVQLFRAASTEIIAGADVTLGTFAAAIRDLKSDDRNSDAGAYAFMVNAANAYVPGDVYVASNGALHIWTRVALAASVNQTFEIPELRIALSDPDAAQAFIAAL